MEVIGEIFQREFSRKKTQKDKKAGPITQRHFFALFAFFRGYSNCFFATKEHKERKG
jgi:hypothetical protein